MQKQENPSPFSPLNTINIYEKGALMTTIKKCTLPSNRFSFVLFVKSATFHITLKSFVSIYFIKITYTFVF